MAEQNPQPYDDEDQPPEDLGPPPEPPTGLAADRHADEGEGESRDPDDYGGEEYRDTPEAEAETDGDAVDAHGDAEEYQAPRLEDPLRVELLAAPDPLEEHPPTNEGEEQESDPVVVAGDQIDYGAPR